MLRSVGRCLSSAGSPFFRRYSGIHYPELYHVSADVQKRDNREVIDFFRGALSRDIVVAGGAQALDIGCGNGAATYELLRPLLVENFGCRRIVATDVSSSMLEFARKAFPDRAIEYDVFDVSSEASAEELVLRYGRFEFVFSLYALHWVRDLDGALANVRRVMRPEGQPAECLLTFLALNPSLIVYRILAGNPRWAKYIDSTKVTFAESYTQEELQEMAEKHGLKLRTCEVLNKEFAPEDSKKLRDSVVAICPIHRSIPAEEREDYEKDLLQTYSQLTHGSNAFKFQLAVLHGRTN